MTAEREIAVRPPAATYDLRVWLVRNLSAVEVPLVVGAWMLLFVGAPLAAWWGARSES